MNFLFGYVMKYALYILYAEDIHLCLVLCANDSQFSQSCRPLWKTMALIPR